MNRTCCASSSLVIRSRKGEMISIIVSTIYIRHVIVSLLSSQIMVDKQSPVSFIDPVQSQHPLSQPPSVVFLITQDIKLLAQPALHFA